MKPGAILANAANGALLFTLLLTGCAGNKIEREGDNRCGVIAESGYLNVLTLDLRFSERTPSDETLSALVRFVAKNQVDVILLQEVIGGASARTKNSAEDLQRILATDHGADYDLSSLFAPGKPGGPAVGNAILSPCPMPFMLAKRLPRGDTMAFSGQPIEVGRDVLMARLEIPNFGAIRVYNAHLCKECGEDARFEQLTELLDYINELEIRLPTDNPIVLGGNLNIDLFRNGGAEWPLYNQILAKDFTDVHAAFREADQGEAGPCTNSEQADRNCTTAVTGPSSPRPARVGYIFAKGFKGVLDSQVVFNTDMEVEDSLILSNYAAVFGRLELP
jgi:maltose 6'-phosphate phosphatase